MPNYEVKYDPYTGKPGSIVRDGISWFRINPTNSDFQAFLRWNAEQPVPLDYTTPIAPTARRPRLFRDIRADLVALSGAQKQAIWDAFTAGNPPLYQTDRGTNAGLLALGQFLGQVASFSAAETLEFKLRAIVLYVMDNPTWLVAPSFDPTINVPGDELVP